MLLEEKIKISEVSEFSILPYTQNWKLGNLGKSYFTSNFDSWFNLRIRNAKDELRQKLKGQDMLLEENEWNFRGFQVFDFVLHSELES